MIQFSSIVQAHSASKHLDAHVDARTVLVGDIVTMNDQREIIAGGRLCLDGPRIKAVLRPNDELPPDFVGAPLVDTKGTIYPGLFDLHNHLPYNIIPLWQVDRSFKNRLEWQKIPAYRPAVFAPFDLLNNHPDSDYRRAIVRFTECRNLFGGVTTGHGIGITTPEINYEGLMRNIEQPMVATLPKVMSKTADLDAGGITKMLDWTTQGRPFIYHLSEGIDDYARERFLDLARVPGALNSHLVCIHCVGVHAEDFDALQAVAGIVWSPTSNLLLYGQTCKVDEAKKRGMPIAIGADWSPSGCKNLLGELKVARAVSKHMGNVLSEEDLVAAVTSVPAKMIGWDGCLGSISSGKWADLLILAGTGGNHYSRLIDARETSIRAVIIDGRIRLGEDQSFVIGDPQSSETVSIGGKSYVMDLAEPGDADIGGMTLSTALEKIRYGLEHLPEFDKATKERALMSVPETETDDIWRLEDEMHSESLLALFSEGDKLPAQPMKFAPMAAVDDHAFNGQMRASVNMPDYAKIAFQE